MPRPFSQACENNKEPILQVIRGYFPPGSSILEIGSGTGQHARHFAGHLPAVHWLPTEIPENIPVIEAGLADCGLSNIGRITTLDVRQESWPHAEVDGVFSANCLHIMPAAALPFFFKGVGRILRAGGHLCVYGPFRYGGEFTSASNAEFERWLKGRDPLSGIRDFESICELAAAAGLDFLADHAMPANNQCLVWRKLPPA